MRSGDGSTGHLVHADTLRVPCRPSAARSWRANWTEEKKSMKKTVLAVALIVVCVCSVTLAVAHDHEASKDRYVEVWDCKVNDGKTMEDVKAANSQWVEHVNAHVEGGDIHSFILTPVVGKRGGFLYADSFPSIEAWHGSREAMKSEPGQAIDKALEEAADCSSNSLHLSTES